MTDMGVYRRRLRRVGAAVAAALLGALLIGSLGSSGAAAASGSSLTGLFGTVILIEPGSLSLGTDDGVISLSISSDTSIVVSGDDGVLADVREGDRVATTALETSDSFFVARDLLVRPRSGAQTRHIVGVVLESSAGELTLVDMSGKTVTMDIAPGIAAPGLGQAVTVVARRDALTRRLVVRATEDVEQTVLRLERALAQAEQPGSSAAQEQIIRLRALIEENGRRHLTALQGALVRAETGVKSGIRSNLLRLYTQYSAAADLDGRVSPGVQVSGVVSSIADGLITLVDASGAESAYAFGDSTRLSAEQAAGRTVRGPGLGGVEAGDRVVVEYSPADTGRFPAAQTITVKGPELSPEQLETLTASESRQFVGVVTRVDTTTNLDGVTGVVIITREDDGRKLVVKTDDATGITVNGKASGITGLAPGLGVAVTLEATGEATGEATRQRAVELSAWARVDRERHVRGVIRLVDLDNGIIEVAPDKGPLVVAGVFDGGTFEKDGRSAPLSSLRVDDLVLNATRFDSESGEFTSLVVRSPQISFGGVIRGIDRERHAITVEPDSGGSIGLAILSGTEFSTGDGLRRSFRELEVGDIVRQGEFRTTQLRDGASNVASLLVVEPAKLIDARGTVLAVDPANGTLVIQNSAGENLDLALPPEGARLKLVKNDQRVSGLDSIARGDVVGLVTYIESSKAILSLVALTPGARASSGRIAAVVEDSGVVVLVTTGGNRLAVRATGDSTLRRNGEISLVGRFNTGDSVQRVLYLPTVDVGVDSATGSDGDIILMEAISSDRVPPPAGDVAPAPPGNAALAEIRLSGTVRSAGDGIWAIGGQEFAITGETAVHGRLEDGAIANVNASGTLVGGFEAIIVDVTAPAPPPRPSIELAPDGTPREQFTFFGEILLIRRDTIFADGRRFLITPDTVIQGDPRADDLFDATVARHENGDLLLLTLTVRSSSAP